MIKFKMVFLFFDNKIKKSNSITFVLYMLALSYVISIPSMLIMWLISGVNYNYAGPTFDKGEVISTIVFACLIVPLVETLLFQWLPIRVMRSTTKFSKLRIIFISSLLFGLGHYYSMYYILYATSVGLVLSYAFIVCDDIKKKSYWHISLIHSLRNLIAFFLFFLS